MLNKKSITLKNLEKYIKWLEQNGCTILPVTNQHERLRFKGKETGVLYWSGKTNSRWTYESIQSFKKGEKWNGAPISTGRKPNYKKEKKQILLRDGSNCFCCGKPLNEDITLEHLVPLTQGGKNDLNNMVLMHELCNNKLSHLPLYKKINLITNQRNKL